MKKSEQELKTDLERAAQQLSESNLALARSVVRLSIFEATSEVMVGFEASGGLPLVRRLSAIDSPSPLRESAEALLSKLEGAKEFTPLNTFYKHYKSEDMIYELTRLAIFEETGEVMVGYDAQYGENIPFDRTYSSFTDYIKTDSGLRERFQEV